MSSEPVVPVNKEEKLEESPYVPPGTERPGPVSASETDRLLEREYRDSRPLGELPIEQPAPKLRDTAEVVGAVVGKAVNRARDLPRRVSEMKHRFTVIRGRAKEEAATTAEEVQETAKQKLQQTQARIQHYAHEYPIQFILGVGGAAFVVGIFLRVWRSSRRG